MLASLVELVHHLEQRGHVVRREEGRIDLAVDDGRLTVLWDEDSARVYVIRWDGDESQAALRLSTRLGADGGISEAAVDRLVAAAMPPPARFAE